MRVDFTAYTNRPSKRLSRASTARHASSLSNPRVPGSARYVVGMVDIMDAPERSGAQAMPCQWIGAIRGLLSNWWLVFGVWCSSPATTHQPPVTSYTFFTSDTNPVSDFFASPKSIDVFGLYN